MDPLGEWLPEAPEEPSNICVTTGPETPIVIDFGSSQTRVGLATQSAPSHSFLTKAAKFRDRRSGEQRTVVGNDLLLEPSARNSARSPFDGPLLTNWDAAESVLDYTFNLVGYNLENPSPVAISETLLAPHLPHRTLQELLFEGYGTPRVAFGADVLGAANYSINAPSAAPRTGDVLLIFIGAESMHVLPVIHGKPKIEDARRINWGGRLAAEFLHELLVLKYPNFPVPVNAGEVEQMMKKYCFIAENYKEAVKTCMNIDNLASLERRIQAPMPEHAPPDQERVARQNERRKESGRRLQEQAAIARVERQERQQQELEQLQKFEAELSELPAEDAESHAKYAGFTNMVDVRRTIRQLNNTLKRARGEQIEDPEPNTPLLDIPDEELDSEQIKEKRRQRLLRASYDARQRARAVKEADRQAAEAAEAAEAEWRARDLRGWAHAKRRQLEDVMMVLREREKLRRDPRLRFRQTLAETAPEPKRRAGAGAGTAQSVNSRLASVAAQTPPTQAVNSQAGTNGVSGQQSGSSTSSTSSTPHTSTPQSTNEAVKSEFSETNGTNGGSNDITTAAGIDDDDDDEEGEEEERDYDAEASALQALLLEHDPEFSLDELGPKKKWQDSVVHKFLWGAHPLDADDAAQQFQLNLNIERMRAVEPIFQPSMVGVDQAGLSEVVSEILQRYPQLASNIHVSGGFAKLQGLIPRLKTDLRRSLPQSVNIDIQTSAEPELDAWRGIALWSINKDAYVTRAEYDEYGPDYIKLHTWGNSRH